MALTDDQLDRYARHLVLHDVGGPGQRRLLAARVLVVGAGGLGAPVLAYLAAAGIGCLHLIDDDRVDLSNLQRQVLFATDDIGRAKGQVAAERLAALNPDVRVVVHERRLTADNAADLVAPVDLVVDGSDTFATRLAVSDACVAAGRPLVSAAIARFEGQVGVFAPALAGPCYRCFVGAAPESDRDRCAEVGVMGALAGLLGSWAALEAIKWVAGAGEPLLGRLMLVDALTNRTRTVAIAPDPACPACGGQGAARTA
ncbi:adenylyltransferase/sulfurtransferase [Rhodothalassium salexigens DSM 2132]|uniref:Molybdopterin-synthase adenylyltransferase n=1 Tax=Rhodothalassium salexigens DSM 2132 TaxID=1188247 RepID=A0A4V2SPJ2_RHOSA|nr:HesA/MoeB/ThiF family protein [Rhodothalassium salexigens]MBB4211274.1 adenylyltransferase/sulfurtransferase [Rhodothalassium salexigens DSM 2132]MBK1639598.1 molybdopterin biosynthesis protein MoeB [Rhodothalassium salexigens DSM 2132]TCP35196.1 adenylyltransferase/sulfurtransferase [Rhodothalassium salexigens DSM 2132]